MHIIDSYYDDGTGNVVVIAGIAVLIMLFVTVNVTRCFHV